MQSRNAFKLSKDGVLAAGNGQDRWQAPHSGEIVAVSAVVGVAPATTPITIDVNKNGVTVFTTQANRAVVPAGATETVDAVSAKPDAAVAFFAKGDTISFDLDTVGTTTTGSDLDVTVEYVAV